VSFNNDFTNALYYDANLFVLRYPKNFLKFWWDQEIELLKKDSLEETAGKPLQGPHI
jgi:hypothetical protein